MDQAIGAGSQGGSARARMGLSQTVHGPPDSASKSLNPPKSFGGGR